MKKIPIVLGATLLLFLSCTPQNIVQKYLDALVQGLNREEFLARIQSKQVVYVDGKSETRIRSVKILDDSMIAGYEIRGYKVLNSSGNVVSVSIIFASKAGTDLSKTFKFHVKQGKITRIW